MSYDKYRDWPKWSRETNFDNFLLQWSSVCISRGIEKKEQKMALLAQALPAAMGAEVQDYANKHNRVTWDNFVQYVTKMAKDSQHVSPYKLLRRSIESHTFKQRGQEGISAYFDRFKLKMREYNEEAKRVNKPIKDEADQVELFEKSILPGYRAILCEKRYELEDADDNAEATLAWAFRTCMRHYQLQKEKQEIMQEGSQGQLQTVTGSERAVYPIQHSSQEPSFGANLIDGHNNGKPLQKQLEAMQEELAQLKSKSPRGSLKTSKVRFSTDDSSGGPKDPPGASKQRRKSRVRLPWGPAEVDPLYGFGIPRRGVDGKLQKWCLHCATETHSTRNCDDFCARCGEQHVIDVCHHDPFTLRCSHCEQKGHVSTVCIPHFEKQAEQKKQKDEQRPQRSQESHGKTEQRKTQQRNNGQRTRKPRECHFWAGGTCWNGDQCPFTHTGKGGTETPPEGRVRGDYTRRGRDNHFRGGPRGGGNRRQQEDQQDRNRRGNWRGDNSYNGGYNHNTNGDRRDGAPGAPNRRSPSPTISSLNSNSRHADNNQGHRTHPDRRILIQTASGTTPPTTDNSLKRPREEYEGLLTLLRKDRDEEFQSFMKIFEMGRAAASKRARGNERVNARGSERANADSSGDD